MAACDGGHVSPLRWTRRLHSEEPPDLPDTLDVTKPLRAPLVEVTFEFSGNQVAESRLHFEKVARSAVRVGVLIDRDPKGALWWRLFLHVGHQLESCGQQLIKGHVEVADAFFEGQLLGLHP